jgi:hypothetical protein
MRVNPKGKSSESEMKVKKISIFTESEIKSNKVCIYQICQLPNNLILANIFKCFPMTKKKFT